MVRENSLHPTNLLTSHWLSPTQIQAMLPAQRSVPLQDHRVHRFGVYINLFVGCNCSLTLVKGGELPTRR